MRPGAPWKDVDHWDGGVVGCAGRERIRSRFRRATAGSVVFKLQRQRTEV
jgi:hypothetical protein